MKVKKWHLVVLLILALATLGGPCDPDPIPPPNPPADTTKALNPEYDHMQSFDPSGNNGHQRIKDAFSPAKVNFDLTFSNWITDAVWDYDDLDYYINMYANETSGRYDQKLYLLALGQVTNIPGDTGGVTVLGETWHSGSEGRATCIIFVYNIRSAFPGYERMVHKTTIHELGHGYSNLSHLCLDNSTMNPNHDIGDCVMAQGRIAPCTGQDVSVPLHFCNSCITRIKAVNW